MVNVSIIGFGNVAQHLASAFSSSPEIQLVQVFSRTKMQPLLPIKAKIIDDFGLLEKADLYIIAVPDDAVAAVSAKLPFGGRLVAHTAGSLSMELLEGNNRRGVFYPLQTLSKEKSIDFSGIPLCLEAESYSDYTILERVAKAISGKVYPINSIQRRALHVSAVFVSNFANHLYQLGEDICRQHQVPFDILKPLISETAEKIRLLSPAQAQTGPAIRRDIHTIHMHEDFLSDSNQKNIYQLLTESIQNERKKL